MAQHVVGARAGTVHFTAGAVTVDGQPASATEVRLPFLNVGQVLQTGEGRVELLLGPGVFLRLTEHGA